MATTKYHPCGHKIWHTTKFNGLKYIDIFTDDDLESATHGAEISACPACGEAILTAADLIDDEPITLKKLLVMGKDPELKREQMAAARRTIEKWRSDAEAAEAQQGGLS